MQVLTNDPSGDYRESRAAPYASALAGVRGTVAVTMVEANGEGDDADEPIPGTGGDGQALARLSEQRGRFVAFARSRVRSSALADDLVQSAFAKALDQQASLRGAPHATAWFYRILRNEIIDQARRVQAQGRAVERVARQEVEAVDDPREQRTACRCVLAVLASLRGDYAGLLQVVDLDGLTVSEAAGLFGITSNNASVRLHRARAALREGLAARCGKCALEGCGDCSCRASAG